MTLLVNFVSMSVHLRSAKEETSSNPCSSLVSHAPALRMQKMNMQLHEQQRRGPVSFQHSSACPYRFSQQSHKSAPTMWPEYFVNVHNSGTGKSHFELKNCQTCNLPKK